MLRKNRKSLIFSLSLLIVIASTCQFVLRRTWDAYITHRRLKSALGTSSLGYQPEYLKRKNLNLNSILGKYQLDTATFRGSLITEISSIAESNKVRLVEVPDDGTFQYSDGSLIQRLDFEGDYFSLMRFIQIIHEQRKIGVVRSLNLKIVPIEPLKTRILRLEVYLQVLGK